jgi:hypothetical protein
MNNISLFCLTLDPSHEKIIERIRLIPVGLGNKKFSKECLNDKKGLNIAEKNSNYGEYTFHYWIWKNYLDQIKTKWVGFCQYRKFFLNQKIINKDIEFQSFSNLLIRNIDQSDNINFDCILGEKLSVNKYKFSKIYKNYLSTFLLNPSLFFKKEKRNLKLHFDLYHGKDNLELAINLLDEKNKKDFSKYMNENLSFHPQNMFICKTEILKSYYDVIFPWLFKCEKIFSSKDLKGYGLKRIYGFLAERFLSYWFTKNYKVKVLPIFVKDLSDYK